MTRKEVCSQLQPIFRDVLDDRKVRISEDTTPADVLGWDSLAQINLISAFSEEFDIELSIKEAADIKIVSRFIDVILDKLGENNG